MKTELRFCKDVREVKPNIFLWDYIEYNKDEQKEEDRFKNIPLKEVVKQFGYEKFYEEMITRLNDHISNRNMIITVGYDTGDRSYDPNKQKVLVWETFNEDTQEYGLCGGILFQYDQMSFHT